MKRILIMMAVLSCLLLTACQTNNTIDPNTTGGAQVTTIDLNQLYNQMKNDLPQNMVEVNADMRSGFYGIEDAWCAEVVMYAYNTGTELAEVWLIKTVDQDALASVQELANNRVRALDEESATYSPTMNAMIKKSQIIVHDTYIALIIAPEVEALSSAVHTAFGS